MFEKVIELEDFRLFSNFYYILLDLLVFIKKAIQDTM